jgi:hypothetical protein
MNGKCTCVATLSILRAYFLTALQKQGFKICKSALYNVFQETTALKYKYSQIIGPLTAIVNRLSSFEFSISHSLSG